MDLRCEFLGISDCEGVAGTAVVIDVMRAFTTAAWAFHLGAGRIVLCAGVDEALRVKARLPGALALKDARPQDGFELTNSPLELRSHDLTGRTIVQRTTAGTVGAVAARGAERLFCASFVCARATAEAVLAGRPREVAFVVTGEDGAGDEDRACAEYIAALLADPAADPGPYLERAAASRAAETLRRRVAEKTPGVHALDIEACLEVDRFGFAMRAREEDGLLVLRPYNGLNA